MKKEYIIEWQIPKGYNPSTLLRDLPSPISNKMTEIYNYSVEADGFYFLDNLVDQRTAGHAMKLFIDEALANTEDVKIKKI